MDLKFDDVLEEYLIYTRMKRKMDTYETLERRIKKHITPFFSSKKMNEISTQDYFKWQIEIDKMGFKYNYKSSLHYTFSDFYEYCRKFHGIENIARKVGNFQNNDIESEGNIWTIEEFNRFMKVINNPTHKVLFKLLFFTGMRKGELLALKWADIDFNNRVINITKTITRNHELQTPKTNSSNRKISISRKIIRELSKLKHQSDNEFIFNISFSQLKRIKDNYCDKAKVKKIKIHEFRHSHACYLFTNKIEIKDISYRLGHSNISITMSTYLKYLPRNEKRVVHLLNTNSLTKFIQMFLKNLFNL